MTWTQIGDLEQVESMQAQGIADYQLENILERYASEVWAGTGGGQMADSTQNFDITRAMQDTNTGFSNWVSKMTGATTNINEQFYNQIGGLNIDDDGYLEASGKALEQMTLNLDQATKLLGQKQNSIRSIGDLHKVYKKDKQKRERAISSLQGVELPGEKTTVNYRDPITGKTITHNLGSDLSALNRIGERETDAQGFSFDWIQNRIQSQQDSYNELTQTGDWIIENQLNNYQSQENWWGTSYLIDDEWVPENQAIENFQQSNPDTFAFTAFNEFFGGNDQTLQFFQSGSNHASATMLNVYDAFAKISSSTYGNLYGAAFDTVGQSLLASELTGKSIEETGTLLENQAYQAETQQKALRKSIQDAGEIFQKTKGKLRKKDKKPKARFGGFRKDTPA